MDIQLTVTILLIYTHCLNNTLSPSEDTLIQSLPGCVHPLLTPQKHRAAASHLGQTPGTGSQSKAGRKCADTGRGLDLGLRRRPVTPETGKATEDSRGATLRVKNSPLHWQPRIQVATAQCLCVLLPAVGGTRKGNRVAGCGSPSIPAHPWWGGDKVFIAE